MFRLRFTRHTHQLLSFFNFFVFTLRRTLLQASMLACVCLASLVAGATVALASSVVQESAAAQAAGLERRVKVGGATEVVIRNPRGRVLVTTAESAEPSSGVVAATAAVEPAVVVRAGVPAGRTLAEADLLAERAGERVVITVAEKTVSPSAAVENRETTENRRAAERVDLTVMVPPRSFVRIETREGAVDAVGDFRRVEARTTTGTIRVDVPSERLRYDFQWTAARPRIYSLLDLAEAREGRGGRFRISGRYPAEKKEKNNKQSKSEAAEDDAATIDEDTEATGVGQPERTDKSGKAERAERKRREREQQVELAFTTERGVVIVGADAAIVPIDLRARTLTEAARAFIRSGDETLVERVRRLAPTLIDEYAGTLSNRRGAVPRLIAKSGAPSARQEARLTASVTDRAGRPLTNLTASDFFVTVGDAAGEIVGVSTSDAPFNLVLMLDTSGSIEERLDFIRRAALRFVRTASERDRIAIFTFRDDIARISDFTADRLALTNRINTIQAGGSTALFDALGYTLLEALPPLNSFERERSAIVVLSDGDDNRSFLSFRNVLDLTRETGVPIYPLYVPSGLIPADVIALDRASDITTTQTPAAAAASPVSDADPTRARLLTLTSGARREGAMLARETGGAFYSITRLEDLQQAYDDIVRRLRTSYTITYRTAQTGGAVRVRVRRAGAVVALRTAGEAEAN